MRLVFTVEGKRKTYTKSFSLRQGVSTLVLASILFLVSSRHTQNEDENLARIHLAKETLLQEQSQVESISQQVELQLSMYAMQIAALRQDIASLEFRNAQLADSIDLTLPSSASGDLELKATPELTSSVVNTLNDLKSQIKWQTAELSMLEKVFSGRHIEEQVVVSGRPVKWGWLTSHFGVRNDPFTGKPAMHKGVDFAGQHNGDVIATAAGIVTWAGDRFGYGNLVEITHGNGLVTRYGHNSAVTVKIGDVVTKGQTIAKMGSTGRSTGVHVHYEVLKHGTQVDPLAYLQ